MDRYIMSRLASNNMDAKCRVNNGEMLN
jgi:hypothetical protein